MVCLRKRAAASNVSFRDLRDLGLGGATWNQNLSTIDVNNRQAEVELWACCQRGLAESVLRRLASDAITTYLGEAARHEAAARPGLQLALSNEPVAELKMLIVGGGADHDTSGRW